MKLDAIKAQIAELPAEEKTALSAWLTEQGMDAWDKQMQAYFSPGGKGMVSLKRFERIFARANSSQWNAADR
jgi:hypothetical protein